MYNEPKREKIRIEIKNVEGKKPTEVWKEINQKQPCPKTVHNCTPMLSLYPRLLSDERNRQYH